jgi:hypothetical protein
MVHRHAHARTIAFGLMLASAGCGGAAAPDEGDEIGTENSAYTSYWCVDHLPCADLRPRKYSECLRLGTTMVVAIDNIGGAASNASRAKFWVDFYGYSETYDVPGIAAGGTYNLGVSLPIGCRVEPGCTWGVLADATKLVRETNGSNNTTRGACIY